MVVTLSAEYFLSVIHKGLLTADEILVVQGVFGLFRRHAAWQGRFVHLWEKISFSLIAVS